MLKNENIISLFLKNKGWIIGFILSCIFGYYAFKNFQWNTMQQVMSSIDVWPLVMAGFFMVISFNVRAYRWKYFLPSSGGYTYSSLLTGIAVGYFFSNIFPARVGDFIRPAYLAKANRKPYQICLYSVVTERVWELVILLIIAVSIIQYSGLIDTGVLNISLPLLIFFIAAGVLFLIFAQPLLKLFSNLFSYLKLPFLSGPVRDVMDAFEGNFTINRKVILFLLSALIFFLEGMFFVFITESLHLPLTFFEKFTVMVITSLGYLLPSGPAGIGVYHFFCQLSLTMFGVRSDVALSAAILIHAYWFVFDFVFGIICIFFGPLKAGDILARSWGSEVTGDKKLRENG